MSASCVSLSKRKFQDLTVDAINSLSPTQEFEIHIYSKGKKFTANVFHDEDDEDEQDTPLSYASIQTVRKIKKEDDMKTKPKVDDKTMVRSIKMKAQQQSFANLDNQQFIQSRITSDPLSKMNLAYKLVIKDSC